MLEVYDNIKRNNFYNWVTHQKIDLCLIHETFCTSTFAILFQCRAEGENILCNNWLMPQHIIFSKNANFTLINQYGSEDGWKLILNSSIDENNVTLVCLYTPNKMLERQHFFQWCK